MSAPLRAACLVALLASPALRAQAAPTLLQRPTILDAKKAASVDRGEAVAISLETLEKTEIAILGVVRIEVPRAFYVDRARRLTGFLATGTGSLSGSFGEPARLDDVAALALDAADSKALTKCRALECDVKLPTAEMEKFRAQLAGSHSPAPRADSLMREWLVAYVNAYRSDSMEATVVYDDTKHPVRSSDAFRALLAEPIPAGLDAEPFAAMLATPRSARPPAVASRISWELERVPGLKPILEVLERSMYSTATHPEVNWMTTKLLYASHYFESQLDFITVADAPSAPGSSAMYLVILRRSKFDDLPSGGLFNIRGRAVRKLRDALRATLANTRDELGKAYADSSAPAPRAP
jgi:hypothetical protein